MTMTLETEPTGAIPGRTVAWGWKPAAIVAGLLALLFFTLWVIPGVDAAGKTKTDSEVRICVMSKTMDDPTLDYDTAKLLCRMP